MTQLYKILLFAMLQLPFYALADSFTSGILKYETTSETTVKVTGPSQSPSGSLNIPSSVVFNGKTYSVTSIGNNAFTFCSGFTGSLTIPNSVTSIGNWAFYACSGFTGSLTIGNSVTAIGKGAFSYCSGFTGSLTIPNSVTTIGKGAFQGCSGFTGSLTIPNSVTFIDGYAFADCPFTELTWNAISCGSIGDMPKSNIEKVTVGEEFMWDCFKLL